MKLFYVIIILFLISHCSFDNKSGIWNDANIISSNDNKIIFKEFKNVSTFEDEYTEIIFLKDNSKLNLSKPVKNIEWNDIFFSLNNNLNNFKYNNTNQVIFKSKKLTKNKASIFKLYKNGNLIINDKKGNIIFFSITQNKIIAKFNFYKKKFKKIEINLNLIIDNNVIFVADNLGYVYAYDYKINKILWAKNYKIPFSSNLKILKDKLMVSNQDNNLYFLNKNNGDLLKLIPTEESPIQNQFVNNLSIDKNNKLFFLNSFGSLYSIDTDLMSIDWFNNFNQSLNLSPSNLFQGNKIVNTNKEVIISSNTNTFIINLDTGSIVKKFNFSSTIKPIIVSNIIFFLTSNNFMIAVDLRTKKILYSFDILNVEGLKMKKKLLENLNKKMMILNSEIFIFYENSKVLVFDIYGKFNRIQKLPLKIYSLPISIQNSILYLNNQNKLVILD